jgi:hypothetical protein
MNLLAVGHDFKTVKGEKKGVLTGIMYLTPGKTCPFSSAGCRSACLNTAGRGVFSNVQAGRARKTALFNADKVGFIDLLKKDIGALVRKAGRRGLFPAVRLNGTSDIKWEDLAGSNGKTVFEEFPDVQFYDYTKDYTRFDTALPSNYDLTFSRSECNEARAVELAQKGLARVAVVFKTARETWNGLKVIDGDESDIRFNDPRGVIVGLTAKGKARKDTSGFVVA